MDASIVYFPSAVAIGALHALEPGHAKTLTAAYLIGTKGTRRDAVLLGLSVAFTHSIVVIALAVAAVMLGRGAFADSAARYLAIGSGVIVILLGTWLLAKRLRVMRRSARREGHSHDHPHAHAPDPQPVSGFIAAGIVEISDTPAGERMRLTLRERVENLSARVVIERASGRLEVLPLNRQDDGGLVWLSDVAPEEPHEFKATVALSVGERREALPFEVHEPIGHVHGHDHDHMSDDEHAASHAATLPEYVGKGERPSIWQVVAFGAAGGMIPCPAAVSVMLLSVSIARTGNGLLLVAGFSLGLALTLVGIGLAVVMGLSKLSGTGKLSWLSKQAPVISASLVILSGAAGLLVAIFHGH
jgi:nickel/cobalt exporter